MKSIILKTKLSYQHKLRLVDIADFAFILFFSNSFIRLVASVFLGESIGSVLGYSLPYILVVLLLFSNPQKYFKIDFVVLYLSILTFFLLTYLIHPEYEYHYLREDFGVWDHVLKPYRGIYAFLFISLVGDAKRIFACLKKCGWLLMIFFVYRMIRGTWTLITVTGTNTNASYSVSFGYEVLPYVLVFMYAALSEKKLIYWIAVIIDFSMMLIGGSRGPVLFVALFIVIYTLISIEQSKKRLGIVLAIIGLAAAVYILHDDLVMAVIRGLNRVGVSSRFLNMLLNGSVMDDNSRIRIWNAAIQMIRDNPYGYGAMGSRHEIFKYVYAGYPHSIILEFLIDFGVIIGGGLLFILFVNSFKILTDKDYEEWRYVFLIFFCFACSLFISLSFWSVPSFWACLGIGREYYYQKKVNYHKTI